LDRLSPADLFHAYSLPASALYVTVRDGRNVTTSGAKAFRRVLESLCVNLTRITRGALY